jgi:hypothetical protein
MAAAEVIRDDLLGSRVGIAGTFACVSIRSFGSKPSKLVVKMTESTPPGQCLAVSQKDCKCLAFQDSKLRHRRASLISRLSLSYELGDEGFNSLQRRIK